MSNIILKTENLCKYFPLKASKKYNPAKPHVKANDGISLEIFEGECLGLVGESGCGKSTYGRTILRAYDVTKGTVEFLGHDITTMKEKTLREHRTDMQIIFQDPYSSLNPRMTVGQIISEALVEHGIYNKGDELEGYIKEVMEKCGLPSYMIHRFPHQFSGGQRQRIGIARVIALKPKFIVCDEAVSALDVSVQSQILNLLMDLKDEFGYTYLFISHDLSVVKHISDRVGVMYLGSIVELADVKTLYSSPKHPYTKALLSAIPDINKRNIKRELLVDEIPSNVNPPSGCKFHTRCRLAKDCSKHESMVSTNGVEYRTKCMSEIPELIEISGKQSVACHYYDEKGDESES